MRQFWFIAILALPVVLVAADAGGEKASAWKAFLPEPAYKELTERSIKTIETAAKAGDKDARARIAIEAAILAGYTMSGKNADDDGPAKLRAKALAASKLELPMLTDFGKLMVIAPKAPADWKAQIPDSDELMRIFKNKSKKGEGIHADLHYLPKLKNLNGIEAFLFTLSAKKISDENLDKIAKELPNLAYRVAAVASLTHELAPEKGAAEWRDLSIKMRDSSIQIAEAAHKKNAAGVFKAAQMLEKSCIECHMAFKKN